MLQTVKIDSEVLTIPKSPEKTIVSRNNDMRKVQKMIPDAIGKNQQRARGCGSA